MKRFVTGLGSLLAIAVLIIGIPAALLFLAGNPFPTLDELERALTTPDYGGEFLIGTLLPLIAWAAWASFAIGFLIELPAQIRRVPAVRLPGLSLQQHGAAVLIGAVLLMFTGLATLAPATAANAETPSLSSQTSKAHAAAGSVDQSVFHKRLATDTPLAATATTEVEMTTVMSEKERTVATGDTLWDIAVEELGDGNRYPEIFEASKDNVQPTWGSITDPNLIHPGQVVDIPITVQVPVQPIETPVLPVAPLEELTVGAAADAAADTEQAGGAATVDAAEATDLSGLGISDSAAPQQQQSQPISPAAQPDSSTVAEDDWIDEVFNVRTLGGIGALAAAGLLTHLGLRRRNQRRNRKPGQRISMPAGDASVMELELRSVENPMGMEDVDHALRHLAVWAQDTGTPLPAVYAIRLACNEIAIYLDAPSELPAPFVATTEDKQAWSLIPEQLPPLERVPSAPYPALVTIGQDQGDAHVLVDLEHVGSLNLSGDQATIDGALTALAVELATSQWSEDLQITLVGIAPGLPEALNTGRVRHVDDIQVLLRNLRGQAAATKQALADLGVGSIEEARSTVVHAEAWTPEIVLLGELPDAAAQAELAELVTQLPRVGIASITAGNLAGDWTLNLTSESEAELQIPAAGATLPLRPQIVSALEYSRILELFKATETEAVEGPAWATNIDPEEISIEDIPATQEESNEAEQAADEDEWKFILQRLLQPVAVADEASEARTPEDAPAGMAKMGNPVVSLRGAPYVQLLGTVGIIGARGDEPRTPQTSQINRSAVTRATELIAFLTLHPGANAVEVHDALWPGRDPSGKAAQQNRNGLTTKARKWLGNDDDGTLYLPPVGAAGYRLDGVRSDWDVWLELIGEDVTSTPTNNLIAALRLVKGQPFAGVKDKYYAWAERTRQEIIAATGDAAHELATRSLRTGDTNSARLAAAVGRQVDPINEVYWRDALRAEHQAGDITGVDRIIAQLEEHLESFEDGYEAEHETQELIDVIHGRRALAS